MYALVKAQKLREAFETVTKCPAATQAASPEEAKEKRMEATPSYLKGRIEMDEELPVVEVRRQGGGPSGGGHEEAYKEEELLAVMGYVVATMKPELVLELALAMRTDLGQPKGKSHEGKEA